MEMPVSAMDDVRVSRRGGEIALMPKSGSWAEPTAFRPRRRKWRDWPQGLGLALPRNWATRDSRRARWSSLASTPCAD